MAYLKYKELTKYFYFYKQLENSELPKYVVDYVDSGDKIIAAFATKRDRGIFTENKMVLFDNKFGSKKQVHTIPYKSISTVAILFGNTTGSLLVYIDSGYPLELKFVNLNPENKTSLRLLYNHISDKITKK